MIPFDTFNGPKNMQIDEDLLNNAIKNHSQDKIFRLYAWSPACVSLGRNQDDKFINKSLLEEYNIDVVRRLTGGRALLHDKEITYSFVAPASSLKNGESVIESYKEISQILIDVFEKLGINLTLGGEKGVHTKFDYCMLISTGADLCYQGKKFIGSAQCRKQGYILQHGSILLDYDKKLLEKLFNENISTDTIISLKEINPQITTDDVINCFNSYISSLE